MTVPEYKCAHTDPSSSGDGSIQICGADEGLTLTARGWLCDLHLGNEHELVCHCGEPGYFHCEELRQEIKELKAEIEKLKNRGYI